jgi:hypothetical protein
VGLVTCLVVSLLVPCRAATNDLNSFLNLSLPGRSEFTPIVLAASKEKTIVARVAYVENRRDIQVLEKTGEEWIFVGANGRALTGFYWNFQPDAKRGPDGRLWFLATYSQVEGLPAPPVRDYLYCFENGSWRIAGPKEGHASGDFGDRGLHFLGTNEPVHHFVRFDDSKTGHTEDCLLQLRGDKWVVLPAQQLLRQTGGRLAWRKQDAWLVNAKWTNGVTMVDGYFLAGPSQDNIYGPFPLWSVGVRYYLWSVTASDSNELALLLRKQDEDGKLRDEWTCCIISADRTGAHKVTVTPAPPIKYVHDIMWSPTGELVITSVEGLRAVRVHVLRNGEWKKIAEASQPVGQIFGERLAFRDDGTPIVTWEVFFPH